MNTKNLFWPAVVTAQVMLSSVAHAQLIEDIEFKREGEHAVAQIRFVTPVQLQRSVMAKSGDLVQVFYNITPNADMVSTVSGERRVSANNGLPEMVVTDESVARDNLNLRKLLIRLSTPTKFVVRTGPSREVLEIVFEGIGAKLVQDKPQLNAPLNSKQFLVILQSSTDPAVQLAAAIPAQLQGSEVFTSRRIADGKVLYDTNLGYFSTLADAEKAQRLLLSRFPNSSVVAAGLTSASATTEAPAIVVNQSSEVTAAAAKLMATADAANDRGDYSDAIVALDTLLNLPPNALSRSAQEQIAIARLKAGDNQKARGEFETFLKLYPEGVDSDRARQFLANLPQEVVGVAAKGRITGQPEAVVSGSISTFYYGGQSQTRSQDFVDSPLSGLPVLQSESNLSGQDQKQVQTNVDLNWRYRDAEVDQRFVFRDTFTSDMMPNRPDKNRLSALYFDHRSLANGVGIRAGRQSPTGGGVLYRFDGAQASYVFAPKWKANAVYGVPTDALLDTRRNFYGAWVDAEALTPHMSGSAYVNQQMIDSEVDRRALGTELRYFNEGVALSGQLDYDQMLQGLNIASLQGSWQFPDTTQVNFMLDRRSTPVRALGNILFFQDPNLAVPAKSIQELLGTTPIDLLRDQVNGVTSFQSQAMLGFTTPIASNWQTGATANYTNVDAIKPVAVILPLGQASTGDLWSLGLQLIGTNLYSTLDTHIFSVNFLSGPTYNGTLLSYNNLTGVGENLRVEPSIRYYTQTTNLGDKTVRVSPGMRISYRVVKQVSLETELSLEISDTKGPTRTEYSERMFYYLGGRFDF